MHYRERSGVATTPDGVLLLRRFEIALNQT